jgi:hypothetical protein
MGILVSVVDIRLLPSQFYENDPKKPLFPSRIDAPVKSQRAFKTPL